MNLLHHFYSTIGVRYAPWTSSQPIDSSVKSTLLVHLGNIAWRTGEAVKTDPTTGRLCAGSPGREFWGRTYEKGWELI